MKKINYKIFFSILAGVFILLVIYLAFDLGLIKIKPDKGYRVDYSNTGLIVTENTTNETNETNETNTTVETNESVVTPEKNETPEEKPVPTPSPAPEPTPEPEKEVSKVSFEKKEYNCYVGEKIDTSVTVDSKNDGSVPTIKSYNSSKSGIIKIEKHPTIQNKCLGCYSVLITCLKEGTTTAKATSTEDVVATAKVVVKKKPAGKIITSSDSYSCKVGETLSLGARIDGGVSDDFSSINVSNNSIEGMMEINRTTLVKTPRIKCVSVGTATATIKTVNGASKNVTVNVSSLGKIVTDKTSYTCYVGEYISLGARIEGDSSDDFSSINVSNNSIEGMMEINRTTLVKTPRIKCVSAGTATATIKSEHGAETKITVTVSEVTATVTSNPETVSCKAGKTTSVVVTYSPLDLSSFNVLDTSVATVSKSLIQPSVYGRISFDINCIKKGNTSLSVKLSNNYEKLIPINVN